MAEDKDFADADLEGGRAGEADPTAIALALGGASREKADIFLHKQAHLSDLQIENLQKQDEYQVSHLRWRRFDDQMRGVTLMGLAVIVVLVVAAAAAAVWTAGHADGLIVEAFSVPPDLAEKGMTGQVIATQIQDRLSDMQANTDTIRTGSTFHNNWGNDIKVQIPDTGVSIGEVYRFLVGYLGHETHITGEVWHTADGIAVSVRAGSIPAGTVKGSQSDLEQLVQKAAESIFKQTQQYRYALYLSDNDRGKEAKQVIIDLALNGPPEEKPWAYSKWGIILFGEGNLRGFLDDERIAARLGPNIPLVFTNLATAEAVLGHDEDAFGHIHRALDLFQSPAAKQLAADAVASQIPFNEMTIDEMTGAYREAIDKLPLIQELPDYSEAHENEPLQADTDMASDHDVSESRVSDRGIPSDEVNALQFWAGGGTNLYLPPLPTYQRAAALDDWQAARDDLIAYDNIPEAISPSVKPVLKILTWPRLAYAYARLGDFAAAHALIDKTPRACYLCVRMRGNIEAVQKHWDGAAFWFEQAVRAGPSLPFAYADWGAMLLAKGDRNGAIAKFQRANDKGPHFADPLEMWGEALMLENRSDLAISKFAEANQYAPNWGRLHLKWGEALLYTGKVADAKARFALASSLDLSVADRSELARVRDAHD